MKASKVCLIIFLVMLPHIVDRCLSCSIPGGLVSGWSFQVVVVSGHDGEIRSGPVLLPATPLFPEQDALFDASQYSFFGKGVVEDEGFGGFEDEDESDCAPVLGGFGSINTEEELNRYRLFDNDEVKVDWEKEEETIEVAGMRKAWKKLGSCNC